MAPASSCHHTDFNRLTVPRTAPVGPPPTTGRARYTAATMRDRRGRRDNGTGSGRWSPSRSVLEHMGHGVRHEACATRTVPPAVTISAALVPVQYAFGGPGGVARVGERRRYRLGLLLQDQELLPLLLLPQGEATVRYMMRMVTATAKTMTEPSFARIEGNRSSGRIQRQPGSPGPRSRVAFAEGVADAVDGSDVARLPRREACAGRPTCESTTRPPA